MLLILCAQVYSVSDAAPLEDKAICELVNRGLNPIQLFKASYSFCRIALENELRENGEIKVASGLFEGMVLSPDVLASQLLPKVLGTYEKEVQDYLKENGTDSEKFVDIGCAEGFYLNGVARWLNIPCVGIDIDPRSRSAIDYAAKANGVSGLIDFSTNIDDIGEFLCGSILCIVDVDGSELQVLKSLNSLFCSSRLLSTVKIIVESDSSSTGKQNIPEVVEFLSSCGWQVDSILRQNPSNRFVGSCSGLSFLEQVVRGAEGRPGGQCWIAASKNYA
tara:strand:+ start:231 stop:1061 length:831 start_codon:yes stop_codon:yes gene_type:complete